VDTPDTKTVSFPNGAQVVLMYANVLALAQVIDAHTNGKPFGSSFVIHLLNK